MYSDNDLSLQTLVMRGPCAWAFPCICALVLSSNEVGLMCPFHRGESEFQAALVRKIAKKEYSVGVKSADSGTSLPEFKSQVCTNQLCDLGCYLTLCASVSSSVK